jgi:hypothetical protein
MRPLALIALLTFALGASTAVALAPQPNPVDPGIADGTKQVKLDGAKRGWKTAHVTNYSYEISRQCYCPVQEPGKAVVHNGRLVHYPKGLKDVATVPRLFRTIQRAIDAKVTKLNVSYGKRGVPSSIYIDTKAYIADEEAGYTIKRFKR